MTVTSAIVLFCTIWAVVFFMVLPQGVVSQQEDGDVVPGTPASAPTNAQIKRKLIITTLISIAAFSAIYSVLALKVVTLDDIPFFTPPSAR